MVDPYRMVFINTLVSLIVLIFLIFYKLVLKKKVNLVILLLIISILPVISIFRPGTYESGDLTIHIAYGMSFYKSLIEGNIIPVWSADLNASYGYPLFGFSYILPYYLSLFFYLLGFDFINSTKLVLAFSFIFSGTSMFFYAKEEFKNEQMAFIAGIFYLFAPYHLIDLHFRVDLGEVVSFVFIPLIFICAKKVSQQKTLKWFFFESLCVFFLILSHQAISLIILPFLILYFLIIYKKNILIFITSVATGIMMSAFYWLPIIFEKQFTHIIPPISFTPLSNLIFSPWRYGLLFQGPEGKLSFLIGYIHILLLIIGIFFIFSKKNVKYKKALVVFTSFALICIFMVTKYSSILWEVIPIINNFQFAYRFMGGLIFFSALGSAIVLNNFSKKIITIFCILVIVSTILNWGNRGIVKNVNDKAIYESVSIGGIGLNPALPKWISEWKIQQPIMPIEPLGGEFEVIETKRKSIEHSYLIYSEQKLEVLENTSYFPGWTLLINGNPEPINYLNVKLPGLITFKLEDGVNRIELKFMDSPIRSYGKVVSLLTFTLFIFYFLSSRFVALFHSSR